MVLTLKNSFLYLSIYFSLQLIAVRRLAPQFLSLQILQAAQLQLITLKDRIHDSITAGHVEI